MAFSSRTLPVVEAFVRSLDLPLKLAQDGSCSLAFARQGTLSLVPSERGDRILVSLAFTSRLTEAVADRRLLDLAGLDARNNVLIHAGKAEDGSHVLTVALPEDGFDLPLLDATVRRLQDLRGEAA